MVDAQEPIGMLTVRAEGAHDLRRTKLLGSQHPYLTLWVTSTRYGQKQETKPDKHGDIAATWTETFTFPIFENNEYLFLEVLSKKAIGEPSCIGTGEILIAGIPKQWERKAIPLNKSTKDAGEVYLHLKLEILKPESWPEHDQDVLQPIQPISPKRDSDIKIVRRSTSPGSKNFVTSPRNTFPNDHSISPRNSTNNDLSPSPRTRALDEAAMNVESKLSEEDRARFAVLRTMGFEITVILKALKETQTTDEAIQWALEGHYQSSVVSVDTVSQPSPSSQQRPDVVVPSGNNRKTQSTSHEINVHRIMEMGFSQEIAFSAISQFDTMEEALPWLLTQPCNSSLNSNNFQGFENFQNFDNNPNIPHSTSEQSEERHLITMSVPVPQKFVVGQTIIATSLTGEKISLKVPPGVTAGMKLQVQFFSKYPPSAHMPASSSPHSHNISPSAPPEY